MAVGLPLKTTYADGDVYSASDVNDTNGTVNLVGQTLNFYAGKNKIINGDFGVWQRGTSFTNPANGAYLSDRFLTNYDGTGSTRTVSQQTFTAGTAPVSGYEGQYFYRYAQTVAGSGGTYNNVLEQYIEDVRVFAGQTVTYSFWAKAASAASFTMGIAQNFGSGGSSVVGVGTQSISVTTSWARYSYTVAIPSVTGKTIGTSSKLDIYVQAAPNTAFTLDFWGVQVETGSVATAFQTATGTVQSELAACQRYFQKSYDTETAPGTSNNFNGAVSFANTATSTYPWFPSTSLRTTMRIAPSITPYNPFTGSTTNPVRNGNANTNHPMYILNIGSNGFAAYVDNSSISAGQSIQFQYTASAEL